MPETRALQRVSPDEWLLAMAACFLLGRDSCSLDLIPLLTSIKERLATALKVPSSTELIDHLRERVLTGSGTESSVGTMQGDSVELLELLGEGAFGKVHLGRYQGATVAVKSMCLPSGLGGGSAKKERMAIWEVAISSVLSHPNIIQTIAYSVEPMRAPQQPQQKHSTVAPPTWDAGSQWSNISAVDGGPSAPATPLAEMAAARGTATTEGGSVAERGSCGSDRSSGSSSVGLEVRLVLELADCGSLRELLDRHAFFSPDLTELNYCAVLETAADIAKGMRHLHSLNILHSDLKARNVLLRSSASDPRGFIAKVSDFGLSLKMDRTQTHVSGAFHGTLTHSAPEVMMEGRQTKASDVYSFGILMYELYTARRPFQGVAQALLGYHITENRLRPTFPRMPPSHTAFSDLAARCWSADTLQRPTFEAIVTALTEMRQAEGGVAQTFMPNWRSGLSPSTSSAARLPPGFAGGAAGRRASTGYGAAAAMAGRRSPQLHVGDMPSPRPGGSGGRRGHSQPLAVVAEQQQQQQQQEGDAEAAPALRGKHSDPAASAAQLPLPPMPTAPTASAAARVAVAQSAGAGAAAATKGRSSGEQATGAAAATKGRSSGEQATGAAGTTPAPDLVREFGSAMQLESTIVLGGDASDDFIRMEESSSLVFAGPPAGARQQQQPLKAPPRPGGQQQ